MPSAFEAVCYSGFLFSLLLFALFKACRELLGEAVEGGDTELCEVFKGKRPDNRGKDYNKEVSYRAGDKFVAEKRG